MIDFENQLNKEQLAVVKEGDGFCLVLAGAGSGKTRAITYRTAYLLEKGVKPENILLLTFTNKAANEMIGRVKALTGVQTGFWAGTFHSLANRILRHYAGHLGFASNFSILDEDDSETILKNCLKDMGLADRANRFPSARIIKSLYSFSRNSQKSLNEVIEMKDPRLLPHLVDIEAVAVQYQKRKQEANAMDFDDLLVFWLKLLAERDDVRQKLAEQFQYILVDEYQDTNRIQAAIIKLLASHHHNLLVVGDDAQSIYSFRAADISNILDFERDYPGAKIFRLETNYRSTPEILDLANEVISQNIKQFPKNLTSLRQSYFKPQVVRHDTPNDEAAFIVKKISELQASGSKLQDLAVLFRAAFHAQALEMELTRRGIPYDFRGGLKFFERAHIKDVLAFLRILENPRDSAAWFRALTRFKGIGAETAKTISTEAGRATSLEELIKQDLAGLISRPAQAGWEDFKTLANEMLKNREKGSGEIIQTLVDSVYGDYLRDEYEDADDRFDDLKQLAGYAQTQKDLGQFLAEAALDENYGQKNQRATDRLVLSTVHQAKGLEWEAVFIINLAARAFPNERALAEDGGEEEERRLFYVAITRAKSHLYLTYPQKSFDFSYNLASPFLDEIGHHLIEKRGREKDFLDDDFSDDLPTIEASQDGSRRVRELLKSIEDL